MEHSTELSIINPSELQETIMQAPEIYKDSEARAGRIEARAAELLDTAKEGMTDDIDSAMAEFLQLSKKSYDYMEGKRKPITQMAQAIVKLFTPLEKRVADSRTRIEKARNEYATWKMQEARRKEEEARKKAAADRERETIAADIEKAIRHTFTEHLSSSKNQLLSRFNGTTLDCAASTEKTIREYSDVLSVSIFPQKFSGVFPAYLTEEQVLEIREDKMATLFPKCSIHFTDHIAAYKLDLLDKLPSRIKELEDIAAANAEEAAKMKREADERAERERIRLQEEAKKRAEQAESDAKAQRDAAAMNAAFAQNAAIAEDTPQVKGKVEYDITVTHQQGYAELFAAWFAREGHKTPLDKLAKMTPERCKTYFESLATKEGEMLESKFFKYLEGFKTRI